MFILDTGKIIDLIVLAIIILLFLIIQLIRTVKNWISTKKQKNKLKANKMIAIKIINEFEELLYKKNIKIPSTDREGNDDDACIYGTEYYDLENSIIDILNNN